MRNAERDFYRKYYAQMVGGRVIQTGVTTDGFPLLVLKMPSGTTYQCELSQDPEGNGPGFLFGLPTPGDTR